MKTPVFKFVELAPATSLNQVLNPISGPSSQSFRFYNILGAETRCSRAFPGKPAVDAGHEIDRPSRPRPQIPGKKEVDGQCLLISL